MSYPAVLIVLAAVLWGLDGLFLRSHLTSLPALQVIFVEHGLAVLLLLPYFLARRWRWVKLAWRTLGDRGLFSLIWVALFGGIIGTFALTQSIFLASAQELSSANFSIILIIQKLQPVFALILARIFLAEHLPSRFWFLTIIAILGSFLLAFPANPFCFTTATLSLPLNLWGHTLDLSFGLPTLILDHQSTPIALLALLSAFAWGSATVASRDLLTRISFPEATFFRFTLVTAFLLPLIFIFAPVSPLAFSTITTTQWLIFATIMLTSGLLALFLYYAGLRRTRASVATICELAFPFTMLFGEHFFFGSTFTSLQWLGTALLLFAILKITFRIKPDRLLYG